MDLKQVLQQVDLLAEAGMCQFTSGGKHEFLRDIRKLIGKAGIQGGITDNGADSASVSKPL